MITNADEELIDNPYLGEPTTSRNSAIRFAISQISSQICLKNSLLNFVISQIIFQEIFKDICDIADFIAILFKKLGA